MIWNLGTDSRAKLDWIGAIQCAQKAYPYQFRNGAKRIRSRVHEVLSNNFLRKANNILLDKNVFAWIRT